MVDCIALNFFNSPALAEHVQPVAIIQLFHFSRVPNKGTTLLGLAADQLIDLLFGADIDAAHWIIEEYDTGIRGERSCEKYLLLVSAAER